MKKCRCRLSGVAGLISVITLLEGDRGTHGRGVLWTTFMQFGRGPGEVSAKASWFDDRDLHAQRCYLPGKRFGESLNPKLRSCIGCAPSRSDASCDRRHLDKVPGSTLTEVREYSFCHDDDAKEVGFDLSAKVCQRRVFYGTHVPEASVVDQHIETPET